MISNIIKAKESDEDRKVAMQNACFHEETVTTWYDDTHWSTRCTTCSKFTASDCNHSPVSTVDEISI